MIYQQITELIEEGIINGEYADDEQVPSTNEISKVFNINPATAAKGVNHLVDEGILYKKRGIGMFVMEGAQKRLLENRRRQFVSEEIPAFITKAKKLQFTNNEVLELLKEDAFEEE